MSNSIYNLSVKKIDGKDVRLASFEGRVLLVVNVASKCGLTPQYAQLEKIYERFTNQGFDVLGFPSNEFLGQEPGSNSDIQEFCRMNFGVKFPMFEKTTVNGPERNSLYIELIKAQPSATKTDDGKLAANLAKHGIAPKTPSDIMWNFEKFLVNRRGEVVARFAPDIAPDDPRIIAAIEANL